MENSHMERSAQNPPPFPDADVNKMTDAEIIAAFKASTNELVPQSEIPWPPSTNVRRITNNAVVKHRTLFRSEYETMMLVAQRTSIPTPKAFRYIADSESDPAINCAYLCMEYISGRDLQEAWPTLWWWQKIRTLVTLRIYVRQLRSIECQSFPGPFASEPQLCIGDLFTESGHGPFASYEELVDWYTSMLRDCQRYCGVPLDAAPFDSSEPLVLVHQDLAPHNLMIDHSGKLWIIDWGMAGFYPRWFEYGGMRQWWRTVWPRWGTWMAGFVAGFYDHQMKFMSNIRWSLRE